MDLKPMLLPLELVLHIITCSLPRSPDVLLPPSHPITQTLLAFTLVCKETRRLARRCLLQHCVYLSSEQSLRSYMSIVPHRGDLSTVSQVLLTQFAGKGLRKDGDTAQLTQELFNNTCHSLKRLIIDIPPMTINQFGANLKVWHVMRAGLERLEQLEEFVNLHYTISYNVPEASNNMIMWSRWRKLKRIAVQGLYLNPKLWEYAAQMPQLETIVLTCALRASKHDFKKTYFAHSQRPLKVLLVNTEREQIRFSRMKRGSWNACDPDAKMTIVTHDVPCLFEDEDPKQVCHTYMRAGVERGTIWDWEGEIIQNPPKFDEDDDYSISSWEGPAWNGWD